MLEQLLRVAVERPAVPWVLCRRPSGPTLAWGDCGASGTGCQRCAGTHKAQHSGSSGSSHFKALSVTLVRSSECRPLV